MDEKETNIYNEGVKAGKARGRVEGALLSGEKMLDKLIKISGLTEEEIRNIARELNVIVFTY